MRQRVLFLEGDHEFAEQIRVDLQPYGVDVEVADTAKGGLARAKADVPNLILLSIQLPDKDWFSVCKSIKKSRALKEIPVIILSGDPNAGVQFDEHRKLATRADDYVQKPVSAEELADRIGAFIPLPSQPGAVMSDSEQPTIVGEIPKIDEEIDAFADDAFDNLIMSEGSSSGSEPDVPVEIEGVDLIEEDVVDVELDDVVEMVSEAPTALPSESPKAGRKRPSVRVARLNSEIAELKEKLAHTAASGVSSRDFLDLRESLNTKDKEILALRDELSARDKQILDLRDQTIGQERAKADFDEKQAGLERTLAKSQEQVASLSEDREASVKRYEDVKSRLGRAEEKATKLEEELGQEKDARAAEQQAIRLNHEENIESLTMAHDKALNMAKAEGAAEVAQAQQDQEAALQAAAAQKEGALGELRTELAGQQQAAVAQAMAEVESTKEAAMHQLRDELENATLGRLAERDATWQHKLQEQQESHEGVLAAKLAELATEKAMAIEEAETEHSRQLATLGRKLSETEAVVEIEKERANETETTLASANSRVSELATQRDQLDESLDQMTSARDALQEELNSVQSMVTALQNANREHESRLGSLESVKSQLEAKLSAAVERIARDQAVIERVRKAMAIGLGLLESESEADSHDHDAE